MKFDSSGRLAVAQKAADSIAGLGALGQPVLDPVVLQLDDRRLFGRIVSPHDLDEAIYLSDLVVVMGRRPGRIKQVLEVTLPQPRYSYDTRAEKEFARLRSIAWQSIKEEL